MSRRRSCWSSSSVWPVAWRGTRPCRPPRAARRRRSMRPGTNAVSSPASRERAARLLALGADRCLGAAALRGASFGAADGPHLSAPASSAEELIAAIGLEPRHGHAGRHLEPLQDFSGSGIDPPQIALVTLPGAVPELSVDPGDPGDEA